MNKKLLLSSFVIALFLLYVLAQHNGMIFPFYNQRKVVDSAQNYSNSISLTPSTSLAPNTDPGPTPSSQPTTNQQPVPAQQPTPTPQQKYKDGQYIGSVQDAYYGYVQVQTTIKGGQITDVKFLQYPNTHSTSVYINSQAMPMLQSEAIQVQSAQVDIISGATFTSQAYQSSLTDALSQSMG